MTPRAILITGLALLAPAIVVAPAWRLGGLGAGEDDVLYYLPTRVLFAESIAAGEIPWINPWNGLGRPFLADPQTAVFYPTTWLFAAMDPLRAYALSLYLHYAFALAGMYRLLRSVQTTPPAAAFGAVVFAFCGFMLAHRAHFTMQHAAAWTPIVLWRLLRAVEAGGGRRVALAAVVAAMQCFAGHAQIAALTAAGSLVWLIARRGFALRDALCWLGAWTAAAGLFAVQWAPTLAYTLECTRTARGYMDFTENSWSPPSVVNFVMPMLLGQRTPNLFAEPYWGPSHQVEQFAYVGILPLLLALAAIRGGWQRDDARRAWIVLLIAALLTALGLYGPVCPLLYWLPGASLFRVPARAMLLADLALAGLAASALDSLIVHRAAPAVARTLAALHALLANPWRILALLVGIPLLCTAAASPWIPAALRSLWPLNPAILTPIVMLIAVLLALSWALAHRTQRRGTIVAMLTAIVAIDLAVIGWTLDVPAGAKSATQLLSSAERIAWTDVVRQSPGTVWVVTTRRDGVPGEYIDPIRKGVANTNILDGVPMLTDYGPLQPRGLHRRFGFKPWGEAPADEREGRRAQGLLADTRWTAEYGVRWVLLCDDDLPAPADGDLTYADESGLRLYRMPDPLGRAYLSDPALPAAVHVDSDEPAHVVVHVAAYPDASTSRRVMLVLPRAALPGWSATIDGAPATVRQRDGLISVELTLGADAGTVEFRYFPRGLFAGAAISGMTAFSLLCAGLLSTKRARRTPRARRLRKRPAD